MVEIRSASDRWNPSPSVFAAYLSRDLELARLNLARQRRQIRELRARGGLRVERIAVPIPGQTAAALRVSSLDAVMCTLHSHRTVMLATEIRA